jgi:hypothetical protein
MKKVSDEEHRFATIMAKKQVEKKKEIDRQAAEKEQRERAINNAERQWRALRSRSSRLSRSQPRLTDSADIQQKQSINTSVGINYIGQKKH